MRALQAFSRWRPTTTSGKVLPAAFSRACSCPSCASTASHWYSVWGPCTNPAVAALPPAPPPPPRGAPPTPYVDSSCAMLLPRLRIPVCRTVTAFWHTYTSFGRISTCRRPRTSTRTTWTASVVPSGYAGASQPPARARGPGRTVDAVGLSSHELSAPGRSRPQEALNREGGGNADTNRAVLDVQLVQRQRCVLARAARTSPALTVVVRDPVRTKSQRCTASTATTGPTRATFCASP